MRTYDTLVIGGGMSGLPLALKAANLGRTAFVEEGLLGGTCLNRGCIPTKTMIASADRAHQVRRAGALGVHHDGGVRVDLGQVVDRKDQVVGSIRDGSYRAVGRRAELDLIERRGRFVGRHTLQVDGERIEFGRVFLNTGTRPAVPPIEGLVGVDWLDSTSILGLRQLPEHLIVVGGGYVGCEFAQMFSRFGAHVTLVQRANRLLPSEDPTVSQAVLDAFVDDGIDVLLGTSCVHADQYDGRIRVGCEGQVTTEVAGSHLLLAAGRTPNTDDLGLDHLGVRVDDRGYVPVDGRLRTDVADVWAMGDLRGTDMFTHTARDDAEVAYRSVFNHDEQASIADRVVPHAVFVDPEVAAVGLTETQARAAGHDVAVGRQEFVGVAKANATGQTRGAITFVADATTDQALGCHIVGPDAGNLIHEATLAMTAGIPYTAIGRTIHVHPTLAEGVNAAAGGIHRPSTK